MVLFIKLEIVEHYKCEEVVLSAHLIMCTHISAVKHGRCVEIKLKDV